MKACTCTALPRSSAKSGRLKCRLPRCTQFSRPYSTARRNDASPIVPESSAPATHPGFAVDQESKTVKTVVGHLPLSPVMDPSYWETTMRHQAPKPKRGKAQNSVERQFRKNPYAQALATPVRICTATQTRLPSFFLQDFNLIAHPETAQPWWVPRSLSWEKPADVQQAGTPGDEPAVDAQEQHNDDVPAGLDIGQDESDAPQPDPATPKPYGPSAYVLARQDLIHALPKQGVGFKNHTQRLLGGSSSRYARFAAKAVWREDMDSFILERMREGIAEDLRYLSRLCADDGRYYIAKCYGWDDIQYKHRGSVLWFGEPGDAQQPENQPGPFATYDIVTEGSTTSVAVHNMPMLLGPEVAAKVRQEAAVFEDGSLFMLAGRRTANLQAKLWKLQGYLADYNEPP